MQKAHTAFTGLLIRDKKKTARPQRYQLEFNKKKRRKTKRHLQRFDGVVYMHIVQCKVCHG